MGRSIMCLRTFGTVARDTSRIRTNTAILMVTIGSFGYRTHNTSRTPHSVIRIIFVINLVLGGLWLHKTAYRCRSTPLASTGTLKKNQKNK